MYELVLSVFAAQLPTVTYCKLKKGQGGTNPPGSLSRMTRSGLTEIIANSKETMEATLISWNSPVERSELKCTYLEECFVPADRYDFNLLRVSSRSAYELQRSRCDVILHNLTTSGLL